MFNEEELEDLLFAIYRLLESAVLTDHGIEKYKELETKIMNLKREAQTELELSAISYNDLLKEIAKRTEIR